MLHQDVRVKGCLQAEYRPTGLHHFMLRQVGKATLGSERSAGNGLNPRHHGAQTITSGGREMIQQLQFSKVRVDIKIQNVLRSAVVVGRKNDAQQPFYDKGIAVDSELNLAFFDVFVNPHLTLAASHEPVLGAFGYRQFRQVFSKINNVLVALFPTVNETQGVLDVITADRVPERVIAHVVYNLLVGSEGGAV